MSIDSGCAAVPPGVAAAPGGKPKPRSADAEVGTGIPAPGPSPGSPGMPGCGPIAAPGGNCWACICCRILGRSGLCCCKNATHKIYVINNISNIVCAITRPTIVIEISLSRCCVRSVHVKHRAELDYVFPRTRYFIYNICTCVSI